MKPLVSILVPAFNVESFLADALESAVAQTWPNKEIIVVDDGSTDRTREIANRFASNQVKVVGQEHGGASAARNSAFALCQGDYVQWLDADDCLAPDKIERQMSVFERAANGRLLVSSAWGKFMYRVSRARFNPSPLWQDLSPKEWLLRKLEHNCHMQTATWLATRELTEAAGSWNTQLFVDDDGEFFCRVLLASHGVAFVPEARVFYRTRGTESLSYIGRSNPKLDSQFESMRLHMSYLTSLEQSDRVRAACLRYLQNGLFYFYPQRPDLVEQADQLAVSLGGRLEAPRLSWKYSWIEPLFGSDLAKHAQSILPRVKWSVVRQWDRLLLRAGMPS